VGGKDQGFSFEEKGGEDCVFIFLIDRHGEGGIFQLRGGDIGQAVELREGLLN